MNIELAEKRIILFKLTIGSFCLAGYQPGRFWVFEPQSWLSHISFCHTTVRVLAGCWNTNSLDTVIESK